MKLTYIIFLLFFINKNNAHTSEVFHDINAYKTNNPVLLIKDDDIKLETDSKYQLIKETIPN